MISLGGLVCLRNIESLDYCWGECIGSLLPICDEVVCCYADSDDYTEQLIREWAKVDTKISICHYPWPNPVGNPEFYVDWIQYGRAHVQSDFVCHLDADEVLSDYSYQYLQMFKKATEPGDSVSLRCVRYNFWRDAFTLIPPGHCLAHEVTRVAPRDVFLPSDGAHPRGGPIARMVRDSDVEIFHYGFLRKREAYFEKSRQLHKMFFNSYDQRLVDAEQKPGNWMEQIENVEWTRDLKFFTGSHPRIIVPWLRARNYQVTDDGKPHHE